MSDNPAPVATLLRRLEIARAKAAPTQDAALPLSDEERRARRIIPRAFWGARLDDEQLGRHVGAGALAGAKNWTGRLLILRGSTASGKTALACALLRWEIEAGNRSVRFLRAPDLSATVVGYEAATARLESIAPADGKWAPRLLVVDDLGKELAGAEPGGASTRIALTMDLIDRRHNLGSSYKTIYTLDGGRFDAIEAERLLKQVESVYGKANARRLLRQDPVLGDPTIIPLGSARR